MPKQRAFKVVKPSSHRQVSVHESLSASPGGPQDGGHYRLPYDQTRQRPSDITNLFTDHNRLPSIHELFDFHRTPLPRPSWVGLMISPLGFPLSDDIFMPEVSSSPGVISTPEVSSSSGALHSEEQAEVIPKSRMELRVLQQPIQARCCGFGKLGMRLCMLKNAEQTANRANSQAVLRPGTSR